MLPLAHLGLGTAIGRVVVSDRVISYLTLGIFLPDLIDKPIIYLTTGMFSNPAVTKSIGHSLPLIFLFYLCAFVFGSKPAVAIAVGMTTHIGMDALGPVFESMYAGFGSATQDVWFSSGISYHEVTDHKHTEATFFFEFIGLISIGFQVFFTGLFRMGRQPRRGKFSPGFRRARVYAR